MSTSRFDATGVLTFDGPARITPVITMLFAPFNLAELPNQSPSKRHVAWLTGRTACDWESYINAVAAFAADAFGFGLTFDDLTEPVAILGAIGDHFDTDLDDVMEAIDFDQDVDLTDLFKLAMALPDGHNLIGFSLEGAYHVSGGAPGPFGGKMIYSGQRYALELGTEDALKFAETIDTELATPSSSVFRTVSHWLGRFLEGIRNDHIGDALRLRFGLLDGLIQPADADSGWSRTVYVGADATDEGEGPEFARLQVTANFIRRVGALGDLCRGLQLAEIRVVDEPASWGTNRFGHRYSLNTTRLVVTPDVFWFTTAPSRQLYSFDTRPLSLHWLLANVTGDGEPIYVRVNPDQVKD